MQKLVVLDLETKTLGEVLKNGKYLQEISVVGIYDSSTELLRAFEETELGEVWPILENADLIVGYNIKKFDYKILSSYYKGNPWRLPTLDLFEIVKNHLGFALPLDTLAQATLGVGKSGTGRQAVQLFQEGRMEELKSYCLDDVKITRDLFYHVRDKGIVKYFDFAKQIKEIPLDILRFLPKKDQKTQMSLGV